MRRRSRISASRHPHLVLVAFAISLIWSLPAWLTVHCSLNAARAQRLCEAAEEISVRENTPRRDSLSSFPHLAGASSGAFFGFPESEALLFKLAHCGPVFVPV